MSNKESLKKVLFEIIENTESRTIYQRKISIKGRSDKEINTIVKGLPTATIYTYTLDEFKRLKIIEENLYSTLEFQNEKITWKDRVFAFLEI